MHPLGPMNSRSIRENIINLLVITERWIIYVRDFLGDNLNFCLYLPFYISYASVLLTSHASLKLSQNYS